MNTHLFKNIVIAGLVIVILFLVKCQPDPEIRTVTVTVPEIIKQTDTIRIPEPYAVSVPVYDTIYETSPQPIRDSLYYDLAIVREYSNEFTDENQSIITYSKVKGHLLEQSNEYTIFAREVPVEIEIPRFNAFYLSGGVRGQINDFKPVGVLKGTFINKNNRMLGVEIATDKSVGFFYGVKF